MGSRVGSEVGSGEVGWVGASFRITLHVTYATRTSAACVAFLHALDVFIQRERFAILGAFPKGGEMLDALRHVGSRHDCDGGNV